MSCIIASMLDSDVYVIKLKKIQSQVRNLDVYYELINARIGLLIILFNTAVYLGNVMISISRMITIVFPSKTHWYSSRNVQLILFFISIISVSNSITYYPEGCWIFFNSTTLLFEMSHTRCAENLSFYGDFLLGITIFTISFIMDMISIMFLRKMRRRIANTISIMKNRQRFQREVIMTAQLQVKRFLKALKLPDILKMISH
ncbi:hypothetical protein DICVIV_05011 [Dictyocaulus viviparus]|uniref:7TM GPCR serpentine receptor class x (Srx) domain-containing protein n=1 Tax=Dictyocaulus viviparus TaxID=29172 RepID=A0A0D8XWK0_DICVI|nr:hypothetical protein DICVIV_05011 [Dictyocaulus viviparus]